VKLGSNLKNHSLTKKMAAAADFRCHLVAIKGNYKKSGIESTREHDT